MDADVKAVIDDVVADRVRFEAFCRSLSDDELATPVPSSHWRVKEYMSHLATIDIWVGQWFEAWAQGKPFTFRNDDGSPFNIDTWNDGEVNRLRDEPVDTILAEGARHREKLIGTMASFTRPVLDQDFNFRGNTITFLRYLQLWTGHDAAHSWDMVKALPQRQADPELRQWFGRYKLPV